MEITLVLRFSSADEGLGFLLGVARGEKVEVDGNAVREWYANRSDTGAAYGQMGEPTSSSSEKAAPAEANAEPVKRRSRPAADSKPVEPSKSVEPSKPEPAVLPAVTPTAPGELSAKDFQAACIKLVDSGKSAALKAALAAFGAERVSAVAPADRQKVLDKAQGEAK